MPTGPRKPARALLSMSFWRWETPRDPTAALRSSCPRGWTGPKSGLSLGSGGAAEGAGGGAGLLPFVCGHQMWGQPVLGGPHTAPGRESDCHPPEDVTSAHTTSPTRMPPGQARLEPRLLPRALPLEHPEPKDCHALWPSAGKQPPGNKQPYGEIYVRDVCISTKTANAGNNSRLRRFSKPVCRVLPSHQNHVLKMRNAEKTKQKQEGQRDVRGGLTSSHTHVRGARTREGKAASGWN